MTAPDGDAPAARRGIAIAGASGPRRSGHRGSRTRTARGRGLPSSSHTLYPQCKVHTVRRRRSQPLNLIIQGRHIEVGEALKRYAERKLSKLTRYFHRIHDAQAVLKVEKHRTGGRVQVVEVTMWGDGLVLRGEHRSGDMYASIDRVVEKLTKQIEKYRSRLIEKRRIDAGRTKRRRVAEAEAALRAGPAQAEIIRIKRFAMKPMTAEEAIIQMDLLGHDFFVFRNAQTEQVNVLYRRKRGDYGLIEPA